MKTNRLLLMMTFMSVMLLGGRVYGQQEVDPTWYDPWASPNKVTAPPSRPQVAPPKQQAKIVSGSREARVHKVRSKRSNRRRILSQLDVGTCCHPSRSWSILGTPAYPSANELSSISPPLDRRLRPLRSDALVPAPPSVS